MMPRLSILIPALGKLDLVEDTLVSVLRNRPDDCEVLVVLNGEYADPYDLQDEVRFVSAGRGAGLVESVNAGIRASRSPIVHLLARGAVVGEGWTDAPCGHFGDPRVAAVAPLVLDAARPERVLSAGLDYHPGGVRRSRGRQAPADGLARASATVLGPAAVAAFYRRPALLALGEGVAFDSSMGDPLADVDLALRLRQAGHLAVFEPASLVYAPAAEVPARGALGRARQAERLFWRHARAGGWTRSLTAHALVVAAQFGRSLPGPRSVTQLLGRLLACCEFSRYRFSTRCDAGIRATRSARGSSGRATATSC